MVRSITDTSPRIGPSVDHLQRKNPQRIWHGMNPIFSPSVVKKFPELIPLFVMVSFVPCMAFFIGRQNLMNNPSVRISNKKDQQSSPHDNIAPTQRTKLYSVKPDLYKPIPELEAVKKDLRDSAPEPEQH